MKIAIRPIILGIAAVGCCSNAWVHADDARGRPMRMLQDEHMLLQPAVSDASADKSAARPLPAESSAFASPHEGPASAMLADVYRATREAATDAVSADQASAPKPMPLEIKPQTPRRPR
jgi:hypothetical protein